MRSGGRGPGRSSFPHLISRDTASVLGLEYSPSLEEALATLGEAYPDARVAIFPSGGLIVPIVD